MTDRKIDGGTPKKDARIARRAFLKKAATAGAGTTAAVTLMLAAGSKPTHAGDPSDR